MKRYIPNIREKINYEYTVYKKNNWKRSRYTKLY